MRPDPAGEFPIAELQQTWPAPSRPRPIVIVGAGGIVDGAHLPAYRMAGLPVAGVVDLDRDRARDLAAKWEITAFDSLDAAVEVPDAVFDLALPPSAHLGVLRRLPDGGAALIQKPMGIDLAAATEILRLCRSKDLTAAVNFQLRFAPMMLALADAVRRGWLGDLLDAEVHVDLHTPWDLFPFLAGIERGEIAVNSIHYLDLLRSFLGEPRGIHARTLGHPASQLPETRTGALIDFGEGVRAVLSASHDHVYGRRFQDAAIRFEGTTGAAYAKLGGVLGYPDGEPDELWLAVGSAAPGEETWVQVPLVGDWFPHAFVGTMSNLQRFAAGEDPVLVTGVEDAWRTMALVESAYRSAAAPATPIDEPPGS
jgi:predicted dehydrogenase